MAFCTGCGKEVPAGAAACPGCGQSTAAPSPQVSANGLTDNVAAALAYIPLVGLVFLLIEPYNKNRTIRFHSFQSLFFVVAWVVLDGVVGMIPIINFVALPLLWLGQIAIWLVLVFKAYQNQMFKLPVLGDIAEQQANA